MAQRRAIPIRRSTGVNGCQLPEKCDGVGSAFRLHQSNEQVTLFSGNMLTDRDDGCLPLSRYHPTPTNLNNSNLGIMPLYRPQLRGTSRPGDGSKTFERVPVGV